MRKPWADDLSTSVGPRRRQSIGHALLGRSILSCAVLAAIAATPVAVSAEEVPPEGPQVTEVIPPVAFAKGSVYEVTFRGTGFSADARNEIVVQTKKDLVTCVKGGPEGCVTADVVSPTEITFFGIPESYSGRRRVALRVNDRSSEWKDILLAGHSGTTVVLSTLFSWLALGAVFFWMLQWVRSKFHPDRSIFDVLLIDEMTNTYSLTKLQFLLWTAAALLAYLNLCFAQMLILDESVLPEVPTGLMRLFAVSAGTLVVTTTVTVAKGSKGSGDLRPSLADFFTHGGTVAPDRAQFFLFTLVAVPLFLVVTIFHDPASISVPDVPDSLWQMTGLSALGYAGGKLVRRSGPIIDSVKLAPASPRLIISGRSISPDGRYTLTSLADRAITDEFDGRTPIDAKSGTRTATLTTNQPVGETGVIVELDISTAKSLKIWRAPPSEKAFELAITNPDGQRSEALFP
jgi:hypothetical protein